MRRATAVLVIVAAVAVGASVALVGSGSVGPVEPGWNVTQGCTPVAPGDTSGSVGSASVDAGATSTSVFAIDNDFVLTDPVAGEFRGNVVASPVKGGSVHLDVAGKLNFLVADRTVPPVWFEDVDPLLFGEIGSTTGTFTNPSAIAVDTSDGAIFVASYGNVGGSGRYVVVKFSATGQYITEFGSYGTGDGQFSGVVDIAVNPADGSVYVSDISSYRIMKFTTSGARTSYAYSTKVGSLGTGDGQFSGATTIDLTLDSAGNVYALDTGMERVQKFSSALVYSAKLSVPGTPGAMLRDVSGLSIDAAGTLYVAVTGTTAVGTFSYLATTTTVLASFSNLTVTAPDGTALLISSAVPDGSGIWLVWRLANFLIKYEVQGTELVETQRWYSGYARPTDISADYTMAISGTKVIVLFRNSGYVNFVSPYGQYRVTSFDWHPVPLSDVIESYMRECDPDLGGLSYSYDAADDPDVIFPAWSGDVWSHLKEICTAYRLEIYLDGDTIRVADVGSRTFVLKNRSPVKVTPTNLFGGQKVVIVAQNPTAGGGVVYDASEQNDRFQIDVGQTQTVVVKTLNYPVQVAALVPGDTLPVSPGMYYVLDSTGAHVPGATWTAAGGAVTPALGDNPGQVKFTLQGPFRAISGFTGPFAFADSIASTGQAALTLTGTGVFTAPRPYTFETGANPAKTTQLIARTIDSFAIADIGQVARVAPAAIDDVSGVAVQVTFETLTADILGFGLTPGALFYAEDSRYRVVDVVFKGLTADITATRHITLDDVDTATAGMTVDQRDAIWAGYSIDDRSVKPLALAL